MTSQLEIEMASTGQPGQYNVRVLYSDVGETMAIALDLDAERLNERRGELENSVLASSVSSRGSVTEAERPVREVGKALFDCLFTGPVGNRYQASLATAHSRGDALRIVLNLSAPELAALPWETMFDAERHEYVCRLEPLVRHVPVPSPVDPLRVTGPLRILGIIASPHDLAELDVEEERRRLADALSKPLADGRVELQWAPGGTWDDVQDALQNGTWHVIHFIGHGGFDAAGDEGVLYMVRTDGRRDLVRASKFAVLLSEASPRPRLVVLNSCSSGETGGHDVFASTAATLVRHGVSAVAAMQFAITDPAALAFSRGFYRAVAAGRGVDEAVRSGRTAILGTGEHTLEWVTPVLYLRGGDAHLFAVDPPDPVPISWRGAKPSSEDTTTDHKTRQLIMKPQPELGDSEPALEDRGLAAMRVPPRPPLTETGRPPRAPSTGSQGVGASSASRTRESRKQRNGSSPAKTGPAPTRKKTFSALAAAVGILALLAVLLVLILPGGSGPTPAPSTLSPGASLQPGQSLSSPNGIFVLAMRPDGNLVDYSRHGGETLWETGTGGHFGAYARLQFDGNLVVYPKGKSAPPPGQPTSALWSSGTGGLPHSYLELNNNGNTVLLGPGHATVFWQCGFLGEGPSELRAGGVLRPNQSLWSPNGQVILTMQQDGNLVEYQNLTPAAPRSFCQPFDYSNANVIQLFQSKTSGHIGAHAIMQSNGNFVVYPQGLGAPKKGEPTPALWYSATSGGGGYVQLSNDGSLAVRVDGQSKALWPAT